MIRFYIEGLAVSLAVLIPNILFLAFPPHDIPGREKAGAGMRALEIPERLGQLGFTVIPAFTGIPFKGALGITAAAGMLAALILYYCGWLRYYTRGRDFSLLFSPMAGIPLPMAIGPVLYLAFYAAGARSLLMGAAAVIFAAGHLSVSYKTYRELLKIQTK